jgi:hypothetical protein
MLAETILIIPISTRIEPLEEAAVARMENMTAIEKRLEQVSDAIVADAETWD